ncbi:MAG: hypothetical protein R3F58_02390 [Steroidobacteraceae bacterium]
MLRRPTYHLFLAVLVLLAACDGYPRDWASPAPGLLTRMFDRCPNLAGDYLIGQHLDAGRWVDDDDFGKLPFFLTPIGAQSQARHYPWGTVSVTGDAAQELTITLRRSAERIAAHKAAVLAQRHSRPPQLWPAEYAMRQTLKRDVHYRCDGGWLVAVPGAGGPPDAGYNTGSAVSRITRDARGGLVAHIAGTQERNLSLWCGDGCKGTIPVDEDVNLWGHWPPVSAPE